MLILTIALAMLMATPADARRHRKVKATTATNLPGTFTVGQNTFLLNGEPFVVKAAEIHYPRIPRPYWEHRIKSCKALGMNAVCIYIFWNIHEQREGQFDFTGQQDVAEFCRLCQKHGMYVIVRPGPYVCAEWEMGGLPWWLLKKKDIRLREQDAYFMERVRIFEQKVGEQLAPLTIQRGGPIIMVQVENEYGSRHETRPADDMVAGIDEMLSKGISFSLYMTHGGTSFGHWAGANSPGFAPDVTSYDYDAPISEYGWPTEKYYKLRKVLQKYSETPLPKEPKAPAYLINVPKVELKEFAPLILGVDSVVMDSPLRTMEEMDMGWGAMIYMTTLPEVEVPSVLTLNDGHDFAQVFIDDKYVGKIDRVKNEKSLLLPPLHKGQELKLLIEAMGRINFGRAIKDFKGITQNVTLSAEIDGNELTWDLKRWTILTIPDDYKTAARALAEPVALGSAAHAPGYYRGYFKLSKRGDTFLNMESFGKGQVYVNGYPIGRFWHIGPQQTLYLPGCWLKRGLNEVVVLDVVGPAEPVVFGQDKPELDKLNLEASVAHNNPDDKPDLNSATPVAAGALSAGNGWQSVKFAKPVTGRYIALQALSTHSGNDEVCVAEIYVRGADGQRLSRESWTVKYADSEDTHRGNNTADKSYDLQESTYWRTSRGVALPHLMVIDLGIEQQLSGFDYLPRAEESAPGSIKDYRLFVW